MVNRNAHGSGAVSPRRGSANIPAGSHASETNGTASDDGRWAVDWVQRRGVAPAGVLRSRTLRGGVSSMVIAVDGPDSGVVVKRALATLRVEAHWAADPRRSLTESRALLALGMCTPGRVPRVLDVDRATHTIVIERAPLGAREWRAALRDAPADPAVGASLGQTVARWHSATWMPWTGVSQFRSGETLEELRLRPFHEAVAARFPDISEIVRATAEELRSARLCLVHGDLSPKNVLVDPDLLWVLDPEVAHIGDPVFDVAFLGAHLLLTTLSRPEFAVSVAQAWRAFLAAYLAHAPAADVVSRLDVHVGCVILARTDGISLDPDLDSRTLARARSLGHALVTRTETVDGIWEGSRLVAG